MCLDNGVHLSPYLQNSMGRDSEAGSRFVERIMTVVCTLKQQDRNIVDYVKNCVEATMKGDRVPSLLPCAA